MNLKLNTKFFLANLLSLGLAITSCTTNVPSSVTPENISEKDIPNFLNSKGERVYHFNHGDSFESSLSLFDENNKETVVHSRTYQALDIGDDADFNIKAEQTGAVQVSNLINKLEKIENTSSKKLLVIPVSEKFESDDFKNSINNHAFSLPSGIITPEKLYKFLESWDDYKGGKDDKGVNGEDFIKFLGEHNISVDRFFNLYENSGLSLTELEALFKKVSAISSEVDTEVTELFLFLNYLKMSWKDFLKLLQNNGLSEAQLIQEIASKKITFRHLLELVKEYKNNHDEAIKKIIEYLKNPAKFKILVSGELVFEVTKFVLKELQNNSFEAESGKLSVIKSGDNSFTDYVGAKSSKSGKINFKFVDKSPVPAWDSCLTKVLGKCVPGPTTKPLNATMVETEVQLDGFCDAKNIKDNSGHYIPSAVFKVLKNNQNYPGINGTLKVLQDDPVNIGTATDLNPYLRLHLTADFRFLNIKWNGVFSGNSHATMTVVGKDPHSNSCFFNKEKSLNSFK